MTNDAESEDSRLVKSLKFVVMAFVSLMLLAVASCVFFMAHPEARKARRYAKGYDTIVRGMSRSDVKNVMGEPDEVWTSERLPPRLWDWESLDDKTMNVIDSTFVYKAGVWRCPLSYITVSFDKDGNAVAKHDYYH